MRKFEKDLEGFISQNFGVNKKEADRFINTLEAYIKNCIEGGEEV